MSKDLVVDVRNVVDFETFKKSFNSKSIKHEVTLRIIYLRAIEELTILEVSKIVGKSKQFVIDTCHKFESRINNLKMEKRINILREAKALKSDVYYSKVQLLGAVLKEVDKRAIADDELGKVPLNKLMELVSSLSKEVGSKVTHETSQKESTLQLDAGFERTLTIEEEY